MKIKELLSVTRTQLTKAESKKQVLDMLSQLLARDLTNTTTHDIFTALLGRERLGSTAIGGGIALPHARVPSLTHTQIGLIRLDKGIDFQSPDDEPVDVFLGILVPGQHTEQHLQLLSRLAELFNHDEFIADLRKALTSEELYEKALFHLGDAEIPNEDAE
jgi:PTS system nitrogen regulatory IIA component